MGVMLRGPDNLLSACRTHKSLIFPVPANVLRLRLLVNSLPPLAQVRDISPGGTSGGLDGAVYLVYLANVVWPKRLVEVERCDL